MRDDRLPFRSRRAARVQPGRLGSLHEELANTEVELTHALTVALRTREPVRQLVAHSTRGVVLVDWIATALSLGEPEYEHLQLAAQLHEIGMITVPLRLLERPGPLSEAELGRVRSQAALGAEIVRSYHSGRTALLIESQYADHRELLESFPEGSMDVLLAGILRVADVFDTMGHPRPYQGTAGVEERLDVLRAGRGSRFHPEVVDALERSWRGHPPPTRG